MMEVSIVVPCYNEASRLDTDAFAHWIERHPGTRFIFVNDGSSDSTQAVLSALQQRVPGWIEVLDLPRNQGKAEAVRQGLIHALARNADRVGYFDADLATPLDELGRLIEVGERADIDVVLASRVALLGRHIERSPLRHYLGRVFATAASLILELRVYDTQCGAKVMRANPTLRAALEMPFRSRWAFDVELIGRMLHPTADVPALRAESIVEEPLRYWRDVPGSKLNPLHMLRSALDLVRIARELRRVRMESKVGN